MRGKRAKALRRAAVDMAYKEPKLTGIYPLPGKRRSEKLSHVTLRWCDGCWKRIYRDLKKGGLVA